MLPLLLPLPVLPLTVKLAPKFVWGEGYCVKIKETFISFFPEHGLRD